MRILEPKASRGGKHNYRVIYGGKVYGNDDSLEPVFFSEPRFKLPFLVILLNFFFKYQNKQRKTSKENEKLGSEGNRRFRSHFWHYFLFYQPEKIILQFNLSFDGVALKYSVF